MLLRFSLATSDQNLPTLPRTIISGEQKGVKPARTISKWIEKLKSFSKRLEETCCKIEDADVKLHHTKTEQHYVTGSKYGGQYDVFGINGHGIYTFPNGVIYDGEFKDGIFNGYGEMKFPCGSTLSGLWTEGLATEPTIMIHGELNHEMEDCYCAMPDRRFCIEKRDIIMPAGRSFLTNQQPTRKIPDGYYDIGTGLYDSLCKEIVKYDDLLSAKRAPEPDEQKWIEDNCRYGRDRSVGPAMHLYEQFAQPVSYLDGYSPTCGVSGLMDFLDPELEDRLEATKRLLEKRLLPTSYSTQRRRRRTVHTFQDTQNRLFA